MALQHVKKAWSASTNSVGLGNFETAYSPHVIHDEKTALLRVKMSSSNGFSSVSQRALLDVLGHHVKTRAKVNDAA